MGAAILVGRERGTTGPRTTGRNQVATPWRPIPAAGRRYLHRRILARGSCSRHGWAPAPGTAADRRSEHWRERHTRHTERLRRSRCRPGTAPDTRAAYELAPGDHDPSIVRHGRGRPGVTPAV